jgi:hypothetical protein
LAIVAWHRGLRLWALLPLGLGFLTGSVAHHVVPISVLEAEVMGVLLDIAIAELLEAFVEHRIHARHPA